MEDDIAENVEESDKAVVYSSHSTNPTESQNTFFPLSRLNLQMNLVSKQPLWSNERHCPRTKNQYQNPICIKTESCHEGGTFQSSNTFSVHDGRAKPLNESFNETTYTDAQQIQHEQRECLKECRTGQSCEVNSVAYTCGHCLESFSMVCALHIHLKIHHNIRSYFFNESNNTAYGRQELKCNETQTDSLTLADISLRSETKDSVEDALVDVKNIKIEHIDDENVAVPVRKTRSKQKFQNTKGKKKRQLLEMDTDHYDKAKEDIHSVTGIDTGLISFPNVSEDSIHTDIVIKIEKDMETSSSTDTCSPYEDMDDLDWFEDNELDTVSESESQYKTQSKRKKKQSSELSDPDWFEDNESDTVSESEFQYNIQSKRKKKLSSELSNPDWLGENEPEHVSETEAKYNTPKKQKKRQPRKNKSTKKSKSDTKCYTRKGKDFVCKICSESYKSYETFTCHYKSLHGDISIFDPLKLKPKDCNWCGKAFPSSTLCTLHIQECESNERIKCQICKTHFSTFLDVKAHIMSHTDTELLCKQCNKAFTNPMFFHNHLLRHTNTNNVQCELCGKYFNNAQGLKDHYKYCNKDRDLPCPHCDKKFKTKSGLRFHMPVHSDERPFVCHICGYAVKKAQYLKRHIRTHTGEKPYACTDCGLCFIALNGLNRHRRKHTNNKPCVCDYCGKSFTTQWNLKTHLRQHTGDTPYQCQLCGKAFKQNVLLKLHNKSHHPGLLPTTAST